MQAMSIRQAARWAERKGIAVRAGRNGEADYLYSVYDTANNAVDLIGSYEKCRAHMVASCTAPVCNYGQSNDGRWLRMTSLDEVVQGMDEEDGEARCIPDALELREWA